LPTAQQQIATLELENAELRVELEQARKLAYLGMMATTVAHEVSQPIHNIKAATDITLHRLKKNLPLTALSQSLNIYITNLNVSIVKPNDFVKLLKILDNLHEAIEFTVNLSILTGYLNKP
jgi:C4-dicarboxylate-specific signal transduction histidine kinase